MKVRFFAVILLLFLWPSYLSAQKYSASEINENLIKTWYSIKVGNPDGGEMRPTKNPEVVVFSEDGSVKITVQHSMMGEIETLAKWSYDKKSKKLLLVVDVDGNTESVLIGIRQLQANKLVLEFPNKATEYTTSPPEP